MPLSTAPLLQGLALTVTDYSVLGSVLSVCVVVAPCFPYPFSQAVSPAAHGWFVPLWRGSGGWEAAALPSG